MKSLITSFFCLFFQITLSTACSCWGADNFCETVENDSSLIVLKGKKLNEVAHGMDFEITAVLQGEESDSVIRIWGDVGHLCRMYVSSFEDGEELILALYRHETSIEDWGGDWAELEQVGDYYLSFCGIHYVLLDDEDAVAAAEECLEGFSPDCLYTSLEVFPLPADDELFVKTADLPQAEQIGQVELFDVQGKRVANWTNMQAVWQGELLRLNIDRLPKGIYFLKVTVPGICSESKLKKVLIF